MLWDINFKLLFQLFFFIENTLFGTSVFKVHLMYTINFFPIVYTFVNSFVIWLNFY